MCGIQVLFWIKYCRKYIVPLCILICGFRLIHMQGQWDFCLYINDTIPMTISICCGFFLPYGRGFVQKRSNLSQAQERYIDRNIKKEDLGCALSPLINLLIMSYIPNMTLMKKAGPVAAWNLKQPLLFSVSHWICLHIRVTVIICHFPFTTHKLIWLELDNFNVCIFILACWMQTDRIQTKPKKTRHCTCILKKKITTKYYLEKNIWTLFFKELLVRFLVYGTKSSKNWPRMNE